MRRILVTFLLMVCVLMAQAQNISVSSFRLLETDLTANTAGTIEKDQNGETAALIKVVTTQTGFIFDGGALGIVKTVQKPSEIWVYVPRGLKKITISHPQLGMLRDYYLNIPIEAARTYEMVLVAGEVQTIVKQARTSQYVVFQLTPPDAVVELDGDLLKTEGGMASKMMKFGTYNYRVQAPDYLLEAGSVTIDDPDNKKIVNISLKPNFAQVNIEVDKNAEIWINGNKKGEGSWSGNLGAGIYELEAKKAGHRSTLLTKDIEVTSEPQLISLQAPTPIYGEADINSSPGMADIFIDNRKVGQTPQVISNLLIGDHSVRITKQGYSDINKIISIKEGELTKLTVSFDIVKQTDNPSTSSKRFHDVELNEAKGAVKCIKSNRMGQDVVINFSREGKMSQEGMKEAMYDADGYLQSAKMSMMGNEVEIKYKWENGRVVSQKMNVTGNEMEVKRTYNYDGTPKADVMDMGGEQLESPYTNYKFDDKGNWISRTGEMMGQTMEQTRTIEYYE